MRLSRWIAAAGVVALVATVASSAALGGSKAPAAPKASFTAASSSDIGKFNDKGFNQNQLLGLNRAKSKLGVTALPLQSNSTSDYAPNFNSAIRKGAKLVIAAGFLLANTEATVREAVPERRLRDHGLHGARGAVLGQEGQRAPGFAKNVEGLTYMANESGCLVGVLAGEDGQEDGRQHDRRSRRHEDPAGRHLDRRLQVLRDEGRTRDQGAHPATRTTSSRPDKCKTVAAERDRAGREGPLPGRGRLRSRHAEGCRRCRRSGASASTSTSTTTRSAS